MINTETKLFMTKFWHDYKNIATLMPSSKTLAAAGSRFVLNTQPQVIVELGAGTGAITQVALSKMHPQSTYIAVEQDKELATLLRQKCPQVSEIIVADAEIITQRLASLEKVDVLISSLPLFNLAPIARAEILQWWQKMTARHRGMPFCQQTLIPWYYLKQYQQLFNQVEFNVVWKNFPPGGFYYCWHLKSELLRV